MTIACDLSCSPIFVTFEFVSVCNLMQNTAQWSERVSSDRSEEIMTSLWDLHCYYNSFAPALHVLNRGLNCNSKIALRILQFVINVGRLYRAALDSTVWVCVSLKHKFSCSQVTLCDPQIENPWSTSSNLPLIETHLDLKRFWIWSVSPKHAAAPTIAYRPGVTQSAPGRHQFLKMIQSWWWYAICSTAMPTIRPAMAPTAILGMNRPDGIWGESHSESGLFWSVFRSQLFNIMTRWVWKQYAFIELSF